MVYITKSLCIFANEIPTECSVVYIGECIKEGGIGNDHKATCCL